MKAVLAVLVVAMVVFTVVPLYLMVKISVSDPQDVMTQHPPFLIQRATGRHWERVVTSSALWSPLKKSLLVASATAVAALFIAAPAAYVISRLGGHWKYTLLLSLFFTRMFPEVGVAMPIAMTFIQWGLFDTIIGLTLAHLVYVLPIATWILVGSFETIPRDLEEAAAVDGSKAWQTLIWIILPLALPGLSVAAIFSWLLSWEEFTFAIYLTLAEKTLPLQVYYYVYQGNWFLTATYTTIITIPVLIMTYSLQRYLKAGYLAGAIK